MLEGHGNDWYKYKGKLKIDFSSNVWYQGPPKELLEHIKSNLSSIGNYPEPFAQSLVQQVCEFYGLTPASALISNGSVEGFYLLAKLFNAKSSTIITPAFAEYEDAARQFNHEISYCLNTDIHKESLFKTAMVWLGNPNNPDGKIVALNWIENWLINNPNTLFVIDEAYADFCLSFNSTVELISQYSNLIVVKSFTKSFAIPGLRLGLLLSNPGMIKKLLTHLQPWSVNSLAQAAGQYIMENHKRLMFDKNLMHQSSQDVQSALASHPMLEIIPSKTNYFLCKILNGDAQKLKDYLINEHGLLIRNASNFHDLTIQHFRIAIQSNQDNQSLVKAIFQWLG